MNKSLTNLKDLVTVLLLVSFVFVVLFFVTKAFAVAEKAEYQKGLYATSLLQD